MIIYRIMHDDPAGLGTGQDWDFWWGYERDVHRTMSDALAAAQRLNEGSFFVGQIEDDRFMWRDLDGTDERPTYWVVEEDR